MGSSQLLLKMTDRACECHDMIFPNFGSIDSCQIRQSRTTDHVTYGDAALPYTEYPLRMLKFEIRAEITEYDANGRGGVCTKRCLCECVKNACGSLQMS